ncbi:D-glucuronyl C5-epimerase family protein [Nitrobacteraceae bacterium UC4449_H16]
MVKLKDDAVPLQFLWSSSEHFSLPFDELLKRNDPLVAVWSIYSKLSVSHNYKLAKEQINSVIEKYDLRKNLKMTYGYAHNKMPVGWWSGMDAFFMPMLLLELDEHISGTDYRALAKRLLLAAAKSPLDGGSVWPDEGDGCWISEYSWKGMTKDDEFYVLNGHLFAMTALKVASEKLKSDRNLRDVFACVEKGTKALAPKFLKPKWPLYMLNEPTIDPPHYTLYEAIQFSDLYRLTSDKFYNDQEKLRQNVIAKYFPIYRVNKRSGIGVFFSASGPPHPYNLDLFSIVLKCGASSYYIDRRGFDRAAFALGEMPSAVDQCSILSRYLGYSYEIFSAVHFQEVNEEDRARVIAARAIPSLDAVQSNDGWIKIDPAINSSQEQSYLNNEGRIDFQFSSVPLSDREIISFEIETDAKLTGSIRLFGNGKMIERYLIPFKANRKQVVAVSKLGFDNSDQLHSVSRIMIAIQTEKMKSPVHVRIGNLSLSRNQYEFYQVLRNTNAEMLEEHSGDSN